MIKNRTIRMLLIGTFISLIFAIIRVYVAQRDTYLSLAWNLFLAWIPLIISQRAIRIQFKENGRLTFALLFVIWLIFFPNAPYLLTDLSHLNKRSEIPLWYDLILILSFAWCGLMTGFVSLMQIQRYISEHLGELTSRITTGIVLLLSSFGVYLGRYGRFNSWEAFTNPIALLKDITNIVIHPFSNWQAYLITIIFCVFLTMCYSTLITISNQTQPK